MHELSNTKVGGARSHFLATVSGLALIISVGGIDQALASGDPTLWFEVGWNFENVRDSARNIDLPLGPMASQGDFVLAPEQELNLDRDNTREGKIIFQPEGSDWSFSASVRFGRSKTMSRINQALAPIPSTNFTTYAFTYPYFPQSNRSTKKKVFKTKEQLDGEFHNSESHLILDFQAGRDVGIGLFGHGGKSVFSAGLRYAQFNVSREASNFQETQGIHFTSSHFMTTVWPGYGTYRRQVWNSISLNGGTSQNFHGLGPAVGWDASVNLWGAEHDGVSFDWGANAALLFGRQKKRAFHQSTHNVGCYGPNCSANPPAYTGHGEVRTSKNITIPNVGGFVGLSTNDPNLKVSFGYRADLFINAIDVGLDTRRSSNLLFHGPYASISIGFGG